MFGRTTSVPESSLCRLHLSHARTGWSGLWTVRILFDLGKNFSTDSLYFTLSSSLVQVTRTWRCCVETDKNGLGATTLDPIKMVAVAFREAIVKLFDIETGLECSKLNSNISYGELGHYRLDYHQGI